MEATTAKVEMPVINSASVTFTTEEMKLLRKKLKPFLFLRINTTILPILDCGIVEIKDSTVTIGATNLDIYLEYTIPVKDIKHKRQTTFCMDFKMLYKFIINSEGEMILAYDKKTNKVSMSDGMFKTSMMGEDIGTFPKRGEVDKPTGFYSLNSKNIMPQLRDVMGWVSNDDLRPAMTGVCVEPHRGVINVIATDAHCLIKREVPAIKYGKIFSRYILTRSFCDIATSCFKEGDMSLENNDSNIRATNDEYYIFSRLIDAKYPDWPVVMAESPYVFYLKRKQFKSFIKLARNYTNKSTGQVRFSIDGINLKADGGDSDFSFDFEYSVPIYQATKDITYTFAANIRFLEKAVAMSSDDLVEIKHSGSPTKAFYLDGILLMPLMLNQ